MLPFIFFFFFCGCKIYHITIHSYGNTSATLPPLATGQAENEISIGTVY